jgi:dipeptidyl-peptidase-4
MASSLSTFAQQPVVAKANYQQASKFTQKKLAKMVFSTSVDPHWLKQSDRFWYVYETPAGKKS